MLIQWQTGIQLEQLECLRSEIPPPPHFYPYQWFTSDPKSLQDKVKFTNLQILLKDLHATHLLKLLDKMYKYQMDPTRTVGATERTRDAGWMDRRTDAHTDGVQPISPPRCARGITKTYYNKLTTLIYFPLSDIQPIRSLLYYKGINPLRTGGT